MARILGMDHIVLHTLDIDRSLNFYHDILGMELLRVDEWKSGKIRFPSVRINSDTIIDLLPIDQGSDFSQIQRLAHFCLVVEPGGLNDAKKAIKDAGVPIDIEARRWGARGYADSFYFQSPEEVQIELREYPN